MTVVPNLLLAAEIVGYFHETAIYFVRPSFGWSLVYFLHHSLFCLLLLLLLFHTSLIPCYKSNFSVDLPDSVLKSEDFFTPLRMLAARFAKSNHVILLWNSISNIHTAVTIFYSLVSLLWQSLFSLLVCCSRSNTTTKQVLSVVFILWNCTIDVIHV